MPTAARSFVAGLTLVVAGTASHAGDPPAIGFTEHIVSTNNPGSRSAAAADFDNDGDTDIVSVATNNNRMYWYENQGDQTFVEHLLSIDRRRPNYVRPFDLNHDGRMDILSSSSNDDTVSWYENTGGDPVVWVERTLSEDPDGDPNDPGQNGFADGSRQVYAADLNDDGFIDVVSGSLNDDRVAWYQSSGPPGWTFTPIVIASDYNGCRAVFTGDINGDGAIDVLAGAWYEDGISYFESDGQDPPTFVERVIVTGLGPQAGYWSVFIDDLDNDGDNDLVGIRRGDELEWFENDGTNPPSFVRHVISEDTLIGKAVHGADLDQDGDVDLMSASLRDDQVSWWENDGAADPTFTQRILTIDPDGVNEPLQGTADGARSVFPADIDSDGDTDVLWSARYSETVGWHENDLIEPCAPDFAEPLGTLDFFDVLTFLDLFDAMDPADLAAPFGTFDFFDVLAYLELFDAGCP